MSEASHLNLVSYHYTSLNIIIQYIPQEKKKKRQKKKHNDQYLLDIYKTYTYPFIRLLINHDFSNTFDGLTGNPAAR
jgi:hypothetical protein